MRKIPESRVDRTHPDFKILFGLKVRVEECAGGAEKLRKELPELFRKALDEVIDTPRSGRRHVTDLEKTEKTYIGTKLEILIRNYLGLPKGLLDLKIDGLDVDIKNTIGRNWMIPTEALEKPCILVACDETEFRCYVGVFIAHLSNLSDSTNRDAKRSLTPAGFENILWLLNGVPYPANFWAGISEPDARHIMDMRDAGGSERLRRLFSIVLNKPISRDVIQSVARQKDYMKRLRNNGGARDLLAKDGIALLSGKYDGVLIKKLGLPTCDGDQFISIKATSAKIANVLAAGKHQVAWSIE